MDAPSRYYHSLAIGKTMKTRSSAAIHRPKQSGAYERRCGILREALKQCRQKCRHLEEDLLIARQMESIAALSGGIAHDYNNLLMAIMGNLSLAMVLTEDLSRVRSLLQEAYDASIHAKELTRRLITFSRGGKPSKKTVMITHLLRHVVDFSLSGSNAERIYSIPESIWPVDLDETQIGQAIHNVVVNALESMPRGGTILVSARNETSKPTRDSEGPQRIVRITIEDQGKGISKENISRIFLPYFSTKQKGNRKGTGLGLSIAYSIIQHHGGTIEVDSNVGTGTAIHLLLPASERQPAVDVESQPAQPTEDTEMPKRRVLVMDDEPMVREIAYEMLSYLGYQVVLSKDGNEAVRMYHDSMSSGTRFDAVVLDLTVRGGMGGEEAIGKLMEIDPDVMGIVSSGYSDNQIITDYRHYGFIGAIAKPYSVDELKHALDQVFMN